MLWALPLATAALGYLGAKGQQAQQKKQNMAAAAQTEFSPWTNMGAGQINTSAPSAAMGALQGGLGGYMQAQSLDDAAKRKAELEQKMSLSGTNPIA